jgi:hypothetical protein
MRHEPPHFAQIHAKVVARLEKEKHEYMASSQRAETQVRAASSVALLSAAADSATANAVAGSGNSAGSHDAYAAFGAPEAAPVSSSAHHVSAQRQDSYGAMDVPAASGAIGADIMAAVTGMSINNQAGNDSYAAMDPSAHNAGPSGQAGQPTHNDNPYASLGVAPAAAGLGAGAANAGAAHQDIGALLGGTSSGNNYSDVGQQARQSHASDAYAAIE